MDDAAPTGLTRGGDGGGDLQTPGGEGLQHLRQAALGQGEDDVDGIDLVDHHQRGLVGLDEGPRVGQVGPRPAGDGREDAAIVQVQPGLLDLRLPGADRLPQDHGRVGVLLGLGARHGALGLQLRVAVRLVLGELQLGLGLGQLGRGGAQRGLVGGGVDGVEQVPGAHRLALFEMARQDLAPHPGQQGDGIGGLRPAHLFDGHRDLLGGDRQGYHGHRGRGGGGLALLAGAESEQDESSQQQPWAEGPGWSAP